MSKNWSKEDIIRHLMEEDTPSPSDKVIRGTTKLIVSHESTKGTAAIKHFGRKCFVVTGIIIVDENVLDENQLLIADFELIKRKHYRMKTDEDPVDDGANFAQGYGMDLNWLIKHGGLNQTRYGYVFKNGQWVVNNEDYIDTYGDIPLKEND